MKISNNYLFLGLLSLTLASIAFSCKKDKTVDLIGNWVEQSDFEGFSRSDAVVFTIGNIGYVGTGYDGEDRLKDFWAFDPDRNNWTEILPLPDKAVARNAAVAFSVSGKGYIGTGYDGTKKLNDFWAYDPASNTWDSVARFGGTARYGAVAFSIGGIGYVGTGFDGNNLKDFWAFDPSIGERGEWTQKTSYQSKVSDAVGFELNGYGYICTGYNAKYLDEFYMYDPASDTWTPKRAINNVSSESYDDAYTIKRKKAVAFKVGSYAYITTGDEGGAGKNDVWEYDPSTDLWTARTDFEGLPRKDAVAFSTEDGRGFVTTGLSGGSPIDDIWELKPTDTFNDAD